MELKDLGVTPAKEKQFNSKEIYNVDNLLRFLPRKYLDFRNPANASQVFDREVCSIIVTIYDILEYSDRVTFKARDINGRNVYINYFGGLYLAKILQIGDTVIFCGTINVGLNGLVSMTNPMYYSKDLNSLQKIMPVYSKIQGMSVDYFNKTMKSALDNLNKEDYLEDTIKNEFGLVSRYDAINLIHNPRDFNELEAAKSRLLFDDMFYFNYQLAKDADEEKKTSPYILSKHDLCTEYIKNLPFKLTKGQFEAIQMAHQKTMNGERINMLVEGDVGCGKTEIAKAMLLNAVNNGYQGIFLAPTNVLALQHYEDLSKSFELLGVNVAFLTGDTKKKERSEILKRLLSGEIDILVGTHAVLSDDVKYKNLALTVVDEEHKFGVNQKEKLREKGAQGVHSISLSATPIPRTLAMGVYGDAVDIAVINEKPMGRLPIATKVLTDLDMCYNAIDDTVKRDGHQAYIICPVIDENDKIESVETTYEEAKRYLEPRGITVGMINGKMKQEEIAEIVSRFARKEFDVLISTTIIEVGVNVPNATYILIKSAERFGLAQLHQLRGRVGRASDQSVCLLYPGVDLAKEEYEKARMKLQIMEQTNDGFVIAEEDLKMRGTGDLIGTSQTGENKYAIMMIQNPDLNAKIKETVKDILKDDKRRAYYDNYFKNI